MSRNISRKVAHARILTVKSPKILFFVKSEEQGRCARVEESQQRVYAAGGAAAPGGTRAQGGGKGTGRI